MASLIPRSTSGMITERREYEWEIKDFDVYLKSDNHGTILNSSTFVINDHLDMKVYLQMTHIYRSKDYDLLLSLKNIKTLEYNGYVDCCAINNEGLQFGKQSRSISYLECSEYKIVLQKFILKHFVLDEKNKMLSNNSLTIKVSVNLGCNFNTNTLFDVNATPKNDGTWCESFEMFFQYKRMSDVTIIAAGVEFPAHKVILTMRSPVFAAMFQHDTKENEENKIVIPDVKPEVMTELLRYIYTNDVKDVKTLAAELLIAADKYEILGLKNLCENYLISRLDVTNAIQLFLFADNCNTPNLKAAALNFTTSHSKEIVEREKCRDSSALNTILSALKL